MWEDWKRGKERRMGKTQDGRLNGEKEDGGV